jgi:hypothetical protein
MTTTTERVQAGAGLLDQHQPGWVDRIDLDRLNLRDCFACVLGQLFPGDYYATVHDTLGLNWAEAAAHGFNVDADGHLNEEAEEAEYEELAAAWRELIGARLGGAA